MKFTPEEEILYFHVIHLVTRHRIEKRSDFYLSFEKSDEYISNREKIEEQFSKLKVRLQKGELLQHLTGEQFFYSSLYKVDASTLIPRPETEILVEVAIQKVHEFLAGQESKKIYGLDFGTGTGCIAIELLKKFDSLKMLGLEIEPHARTLAQENAKRILGDPGDRFQVAPILSEKHQSFNFIVSNPPYLVNESEVEPGVLQFEPKTALFSKDGDPLYFYRELKKIFVSHVADAFGFMILEIPHERAMEIQKLFVKFSLELVLDLNQRPRVLIVKNRPNVKF